MKVSLIISTYNRPDALRLVILSAFNQTSLPDEIIIGDDGSKENTATLIKEMQVLSSVPLVHLWQEDKGFRLAMMRNKCVAVATGDYIIEIDGDVIMDSHFVEDHIKFATPGHYLKGGRTNLGPELTERLCAGGVLKPLTLFTSGYQNKRENSIRLPFIASWLAPWYRKNRETALGCNMSFYRSDFIAVNGYDEFYEGWGGEDWDLGRRFQSYGLKKLHLKFAGVLFHLWHEDKFMYNKEKNFKRMYEDKPFRISDGIDKYLTSSNPSPEH